ncbi:glycosyltransferase family 4 protein [Roseimaritima sediminicola]|uniref:glycosyltransferase family 4 protein n=1 Tax=Roseimaritima sediminicola TaxID=2662066 RepID=UPI0012984CBF|nr:glycosyltransferase family 4 protein [Roseimaritima sediminicola]
MSKKPKRILMLLENESFPEDTRVLLEARSLVAAGYAVTVICPTSAPRRYHETIDGVRVYRYRETAQRDGLLGYMWEYGYSLVAMTVLSLWVWLRRGFDVVHVHTPPDLTALIAIAYQAVGKRFVFDHHDLSPELYQARRGASTPNFVYRALCFFERLACRRADRLIATNASQQHIQITRGGAAAEHCYVVRNGPNQRFLQHVQPEPSLCESGKLVLGYVGAIGIQDNVDTLAHVARRLRVHSGREDFRVVIVGDGPAMDRLREEIDRLDVGDLFVLTGMIPFASVPAYIAAFDICLTPDHSNPYNDSCTTIKTMEYMALGKPTVCFQTRENRHTAGDAALYAQDNAVASFAAAVLRLMDDATLRKRMGALGRKRIDDGLTWSHQAVALLELYRSLLPASVVSSPALPKPHDADVATDPAGKQPRTLGAATDD